MASRGKKRADLQRREIFRLPYLPADQCLCDSFVFSIGKATFIAVTALCNDKDRPAPTRIFRLTCSPSPTVDPEPILTLSLFHPRNLAVGPESNGARWVWFADHGPDRPPFPGGCAPLFRIHESGEVTTKQDPLLQRPAFSFDGCIWEKPGTEELFLYQCNIGITAPPRLLRWRSPDETAEDLSTRLPAKLLACEERFLVSRIVGEDREGVDIFLGSDYSDSTAIPQPRDLILRLPFHGNSVRSPHPVPPRLNDKTWSTVEALLFHAAVHEPASLLAIYHDFGFTEGVAEILTMEKPGHLRRSPTRLPLRSLKKKRAWISRAAVGDLDGDGRSDIVLYLRATEGGCPESSNNLMILRQNSSGDFDYYAYWKTGYDTHFVGGFFVGAEFFQLRSDGALEHTWFSF